MYSYSNLPAILDGTLSVAGTGPALPTVMMVYSVMVKKPVTTIFAWKEPLPAMRMKPVTIKRTFVKVAAAMYPAFSG